jgi:hypothetical protein
MSCYERRDECSKKGQLTQSDEILEAAEDFMGTKNIKFPPLRTMQIQQAEYSRGGLSPASVSTPGEPLSDAGDAENVALQFGVSRKNG